MIGNCRSSSSPVKVSINVSKYKIRTTTRIRPWRHNTVEIIHDKGIKRLTSRVRRGCTTVPVGCSGGGEHQWNNLWFRCYPKNTQIWYRTIILMTLWAFLETETYFCFHSNLFPLVESLETETRFRFQKLTRVSVSFT